MSDARTTRYIYATHGRFPTAIRSRTAGVGLALALALVPTTSSQAAQVAVVGEQLVVKGTGDTSDLVDVAPRGQFYEVYSGKDELQVGPGCVSESRRLAVCLFPVTGVEVDGGRGNDLIGLWDVSIPVNAEGGTGDDLLESGSATDSLEGGGGDDGLVSGAGDDRLTGGDGDDALSGGDGDDVDRGSAGDDVLDGDHGTDVILGGMGRDLVRGGRGDDRIDGDDGDDAVIGGPGRDKIEGGPGEDEIFGADGRRDSFRFCRNDRVQGDSGERPRSCGQLPRDAKEPTVWPPPPASALSPSARLARVFQPDIRVRRTEIRRPGRASRTTVCLSGLYRRRVRVRVETYTSQRPNRRRRLNRFEAVAAAKGCKTIRRPPPGGRAVSARARLIR